ncbi:MULTISPECIES: tyrosine-type recombinase/integrase [unclassified Pseudomonas]|uniref:tyrosine-type recombinase/integrase n=1 Tax=unclassified Pseudomonas TaxID=196821 RepID=UPI001CBE3A4D|nr:MULTISPECIES: tyrosine-type recombinase/integrase [unclassified Pseudomonas]
MKTTTKLHPVTSDVTSFAIPLRPTTRLAKPYHYRRNGIYYLRLRETGSTTQSTSVSLKTTDRRAAMDASRRLAETIKAFHLDHPEATWSELREHLLSVAESLLSSAHDVHSLRDWGDLYEDVRTNLSEIAATMPLSVDQHEHVARAREVMSAAQVRLQGDSVPLVNIIRDLEGGSKNDLKHVTGVPVSLSVLAPMTFEVLSGLYMADRAGEQKASTLSSTKFTHGVLCTEFGALDLRMHTRADLVALRDRLATTRKPSTVNQMLMKLSAVLNWSVENGHLEKSYDKKLKFTKGTESTRKAFSQDQIGSLMAYANKLPETSWKRWLLSLGIITGGRLNEISQLSVSDIQTLNSGIVVIHINEVGEGKSIKNKRSERLVPLTDGAYGFDLQAFLRYVETCKQSGNDSLAQIGYRPAGEWVNQQAIPQALGESYVRGLVFHSLCHSLASLMQAKGVPTTHAQAVMGHASGTVTFDIYGSGVPVAVIAEMLNGLLCEHLETL